MKFNLALVAMVAIFLGETSSLVARTWTNREGKKIEAEIEAKGEDWVRLKLGSGKVAKLGIQQLSDADQKFIEAWEPAAAGENADNTTPKSDTKSTTPDLDTIFLQAWPKVVTADVGIEVTENKTSDGWIYESPNYQFIANAELGTGAVKRFAILFEATRLYMQQLPLGNTKAHLTTEKYKVYLLETKQQYIQAGGHESSAGFYSPAQNIIKVPFTSLGLVKRGSAYAVDYDKTNDTLSHEIAHQLTDVEFLKSPHMAWYQEGLAEYVGMTPYRGGKFIGGVINKHVRQKVTAHDKKTGYGRMLGDAFTMPSLEKFMNLTYGGFQEHGGNGYAYAVMIVTYFFEFRGEGDAADIKEILKLMKAGKNQQEATLAVVGSYQALQEDFQKQWSKRGVKISFN